MLRISLGIQVPLSEIEFTFVRSSGPGGQNVNKVNSKAVLRWNLVASPGLSETVRARLISQLGERLTRAGELIITSDRFRDQGRNREDCLEKLGSLLAAAAKTPKYRKETKPTFSSRRKTGENKRLQSAKKSLRRSPRDHDD